MKTPAQQRATAKYDKKAYKQTLLLIKRDEYDYIRAAIDASGESINSFVIGAIYEKIARLEKEKPVI